MRDVSGIAAAAHAGPEAGAAEAGQAAGAGACLGALLRAPQADGRVAQRDGLPAAARDRAAQALLGHGRECALIVLFSRKE